MRAWASLGLSFCKKRTDSVSIGNLTDSLRVSKYSLAPLPTGKGREGRRKGSLDPGWKGRACPPLCSLLHNPPLGSSTTSSLNPITNEQLPAGPSLPPPKRHSSLSNRSQGLSEPKPKYSSIPGFAMHSIFLPIPMEVEGKSSRLERGSVWGAQGQDSSRNPGQGLGLQPNNHPKE